jgi:tRNA(fMet)-specific endonuclease VapC
MMRFLLDTGSAADYIHRRQGVCERACEVIRHGDRVGTCLPVLAELWYGVENSSSRERNAERLRRVLPELIVWPFTEQAAETYGQIAAHLRRIGRPIGKMDMLIAAIALCLGKTTVVSADGDLTVVPGLTSRAGQRRQTTKVDGDCRGDQNGTFPFVFDIVKLIG